MNRSDELEHRLVAWGKEYGGGKYEDTGWQGISPIAVLMRYHGRPPQGLAPPRSGVRTPADEVHEAVAALAAQREGWPSACCLRAEYLTPGLANQARLQRLRRDFGVCASRVRYYQLLRIGRIHVAAWIRVPFSEMFEEVIAEGVV